MCSIEKCDGGCPCCTGVSGSIVDATDMITADVRNVEDNNTVMDLR